MLSMRYPLNLSAFILSTSLVLTTVAENIPCDDNTESSVQAIPSTTSVVPTTTENPGCPRRGLVPFRRKNGWWCSGATINDVGLGNTPMSKEFATSNCKLNRLELSSLETEEEWTYYRNYLVRIGYVSGVWFAMNKNTTTGEYYWNDGQAEPKLNYPQPTATTSNGQVAWIVDKNATSPPYGHLAVVPENGEQVPYINMGICGGPGRQFT